MQRIQSLTRWLGLTLACGTFTTAVTTQAAKPPKPPPSPAYVTVFVGGLRSSDGLVQASVSDLNNLGQVVGGTSIQGYDSAHYSQAFLLNPRDTDGDGVPDTWFVDELQNATGAPGADGQNDLIIGLGVLPGASSSGVSAINDLGMVVGASDAGGFVVVPTDTDSDGQPEWWRQADGQPPGVNDLMVQLVTFQPGADCAPTDINGHGQIVGTSGGKGFLLTPVQIAPGLWQWFQDDGSGGNALVSDLGDFSPSSINDSGQIVGSLGGRAALRKLDGSMIDLRAGGTESLAVVINNRGQIGLRVHLSAVGFQDWRARLLTPLDKNKDGLPDTWYQDLNGDGVNDLMVDLGTVERLTSSAVAQHGLNDGGSAVGTSWNYRSAHYNRAPFLWQNGVIQSLKSLTGGTIEFWDVSAINEAKQILCQVGPMQACILLPTR